MARRWKALGAAAIVVGLCVIAYIELRPGQEPSLTAAQMREDLMFLRDVWAPMDGSFTPDEFQVFESIVDETLTNTDTLSSAEFALEVARAVAVSGNGHTEAAPYRFLHYLPIRVWWFSDGLYIVEAEPGQEDLVGGRIDRIGSVTAEEALSLVAPFISGTMEHIRFSSTSHLISVESLYHAGVTQSADEVTLSLALETGESTTVTLTQQRASRGQTGGIGVPIPSPPDAMSRWAHVLDRAPETSPAFRPPAVDIAYEWMADNSVLYIRSNAILSFDDRSLHDKLLELLYQAASERQPQFVIVDLRLNSGGNFFNSIVFAQMLPHVVPEDGHVFVLIGNGTFSAAIVTAAMLKISGGQKVSFVGERMGDRPQFWSEGVAVPLPNSQIPVTPASGYHDWSNGCSEVPECFVATAVYARPGISLEPDVEVSMSFEDYVNGRDSVLETALSLAQSAQ